MSLMEYTFFSKRPQVGQYQLHPLSVGRLAVLEERGNPLATGDGGGQEDRFSIQEALLVASSSGDDLAEWSLEDEPAWKLRVRRFAMDISNDDLNEFWEISMKELKAAQDSMVAPPEKSRGKSGKAKRKRATRSK